jgi:AP2-associated kinase
MIRNHLIVMKEIKVIGLIKGHLNVVTLVAHDVFDMGRTKEALLVMDFCERSLVSAMESRGNGYYEEKALLIFGDVCNAVFGMHTGNHHQLHIGTLEYVFAKSKGRSTPRT